MPNVYEEGHKLQQGFVKKSSRGSPWRFRHSPSRRMFQRAGLSLCRFLLAAFTSDFGGTSVCRAIWLHPLNPSRTDAPISNPWKSEFLSV